jgi:hypothetical protein
MKNVLLAQCLRQDGRVIISHVVRRWGNGEGFPDLFVRRGDEKGIDNVVKKRSSQHYFSEQVGR